MMMVDDWLVQQESDFPLRRFRAVGKQMIEWRGLNGRRSALRPGITVCPGNMCEPRTSGDSCVS